MRGIGRVDNNLINTDYSSVSLDSFNEFAKKSVSEGKAKAVSVISSQSVKKSTETVPYGGGDYIGNLARSNEQKAVNNCVRQRFFNAIVERYGGKWSDVPSSVKDAMKLQDYVYGVNAKALKDADDISKFQVDSGKPLSARRINAVMEAISRASGLKLEVPDAEESVSWGGKSEDGKKATIFTKIKAYKAIGGGGTASFNWNDGAVKWFLDGVVNGKWKKFDPNAIDGQTLADKFDEMKKRFLAKEHEKKEIDIWKD